ncbi:unnamed protein product, partial [Musa banksii]
DEPPSPSHPSAALSFNNGSRLSLVEPPLLLALRSIARRRLPCYPPLLPVDDNLVPLLG